MTDCLELQPVGIRRTFCLWGLLLCLTHGGTAHAAAFASDWRQAHDRIWLGACYWANPMEDWCIQNGRLECTSSQPGRNVHVLTQQFGKSGAFTASVRCGLLEGEVGAVGFELGIHDQIVDYRGNCFWGSGVPAYITTTGKLRLAGRTVKLAGQPSFEDLTLRLEGQPQGDAYRLTLFAIHTGDGKDLGEITANVPADRLVGNIALAHNPRRSVKKPSARFWFADWRLDGGKLDADPSRCFGPILWAMHTVSDSRGRDGHVMKMTAQMPPLGKEDSSTVKLQAKKAGQWETLGEETIDPDARTATFRVAHWPAEREVPYRLVYAMLAKDGTSKDHYWSGTVRKEVTGRELVLAGMTCQYHYGFPYTPLVTNLAALDPDMLYFSGDQIYEANGGFGIVRTPDDRAIVNYLRKWYMFGWAFGNLMRDRPAICIPDDHDVFHGNLWGEAGGDATGTSSSTSGGYLQSPRFVNVVHRTNTSHHPRAYDPTPVQRGISVYYGDLVYGRVSFAILSDRQFKSGPELVDTGGGRADHLMDPKIDPATLDKPGLVLLGDRQIKFLREWVEDWRGADMKVLLSQTLFANAATHHGKHDNFLIADLDSGGWPQSARNRALRVIRKGFPLHVCGDQHLTTLVHYGVDEQRDSCWSFCTPAICVGYQRWWRVDEIGRPYQHRPAHGLPNTGEYLDGFGNRLYVYAVGNPAGSRDENRYTQADIKASGFGIIRIDRTRRTYTCESYRFDVDARQGEAAQFPGWPLTIQQADNYGRKRLGHLGPYTLAGVAHPVVKLYREEDGELVYALRFGASPVRPWVFEMGQYTVKIGDPDRDQWKTYSEQRFPRKGP